MTTYQPPSASMAPRFTGIRTFMRLPNVQTTKDIDFAVVGIPFDTGASYKTGARFGPSSIREASTLMRNYNMNLDVNLFDHLSGVDYGDLPILPGDILETYQRIESGLLPLVRDGVVPISIGGDHSITLGELRAIAAVHGPVALVHFDSHLDTWEDYWGLKYTHGTPFRRACEEGLIDVDHSIQIGIRGSQYGPEDIQGSIDLGFQVVTANEIHQDGIQAIGRKIAARVGNAKAFCSFDIDFLDPSCAPGTGTIEVGGFTSYQALYLIRALKEVNFVGFDIVEVLPTIDIAGITASAAANIAHEFLAILALQKKGGK